MDTDKFTLNIKNDIYEEIAEDVEASSNYKLDRPQPKEKHKNIIGLINER